jgi:hypothetical protein
MAGMIDFSQIGELIGLASTAVGTTGKAVSTIQDVKNLFSGDKNPDKGKVQELLNTLATQLTSANMLNVQLSDTLRILSRELKEQDEFETEKSRYELYQSREGALVFKLKEDMADGQPQHFICPSCLNKDKLFSYLAKRGDYMICQVNEAHLFKFSDTPWPQPIVTRRRDDWLA